MKRSIIGSLTIILTSCTLSSPTGLNQLEKGSSPSPLSLSSLDKLRARYSSKPVKEPVRYNHKGIPHHRSIDQYPASTLAGAAANQLSILVADDTDEHKIAEELSRLGYQVNRCLLKNIVVTLPESGISALKKHYWIIDSMPEVRLVEPRIPLHISAAPNDQEYVNTNQWGLIGNFSIEPNRAWDFADIINSPYRVAILDTGIFGGHTDLNSKMDLGTNTRPSYSAGLCTLYPLYDSDTGDYQGHGTIVAGIAAASTNNTVGIAGAGWGSRLIPCAINEPADGSAIYADNAWVAAIWAMDNGGAKVLNCSFGASDEDYCYFLRDMVYQAEKRGIPVVCASGNGNKNSLDYPARFSNPNVIAVGAIDENGDRAIWGSQGSNYGEGLDLMAPGNNIVSTSRTGGLAWDSGTSMAAPFVSGSFASLWYACRALPYSQIRDVLCVTASDIGPAGWDTETGYGLLNFGHAAEFMLDSGIIYQSVGNEPQYIHGYTRNPVETVEANYEKMAFRLSKTQESGTLPFYHLYFPSNNDRVLTTDINEKTFDGTSGILDESYPGDGGIIGYIGTYAGAGGQSMPLYRLHNLYPSPYGGGHYYTKSAAERDTLISQGWNYDGVCGYIFD